MPDSDAIIERRIITMDMETQIREALARGYCTPENSHKILDGEIINAMTKEVLTSFQHRSAQCDMPKFNCILTRTGCMNPGECGGETYICYVCNRNLPKFMFAKSNKPDELKKMCSCCKGKGMARHGNSLRRMPVNKRN